MPRLGRKSRGEKQKPGEAGLKTREGAWARNTRALQRGKRVKAGGWRGDGLPICSEGVSGDQEACHIGTRAKGKKASPVKNRDVRGTWPLRKTRRVGGNARTLTSNPRVTLSEGNVILPTAVSAHLRERVVT